MSFSVEQLKLLDSFQFMASSLERLVNATDKADFKITKSEFGDKTDLVLRKGVYPYEYIDSQSKFEETQLPSIDKFYSKLSDDSINQKDYEHAQAFKLSGKRVWVPINLTLYTITPHLSCLGVLCLNTHKKIDLELLTDMDIAFVHRKRYAWWKLHHVL